MDKFSEIISETINKSNEDQKQVEDFKICLKEVPERASRRGALRRALERKGELIIRSIPFKEGRRKRKRVIPTITWLASYNEKEYLIDKSPQEIITRQGWDIDRDVLIEFLHKIGGDQWGYCEIPKRGKMFLIKRKLILKITAKCKGDNLNKAPSRKSIENEMDSRYGF